MLVAGNIFSNANYYHSKWKGAASYYNLPAMAKLNSHNEKEIFLKRSKCYF
jgi:hypothetical protein